VKGTEKNAGKTKGAKIRVGEEKGQSCRCRDRKPERRDCQVVPLWRLGVGFHAKDRGHEGKKTNVLKTEEVRGHRALHFRIMGIGSMTH